MKKYTLIILCFGLFLSGRLSNAAVSGDVRFRNIRDKVNRLITEGKAASISIAVAKNGKLLWEESFGWADLEKKVRATPYTKYRSGSIAKTITATGLMTLVEKGWVDLEKPVLDYLPHLKMRSFIGDNKEITIRHILNHRSGMPSYCELFFEDEPEGPRDFPETVKRYGIITYAPGRSFIYCNLGYELMAYLISEVSGLSYSNYIHENVFQPLGMTDSRVFTKRYPIEQRAVCYTPEFKPIPDYWASYPGASDIYFSAHDLIRFAMFHLKDHLQDQKSVLSDETIDKMQEVNPPSNTTYGLGWYFDVNDAGYRSVHHGGECPGADNFMRLIPSEDMALVILCNTEIGNKLNEIQEEICNILIPGFSGTKEEGQPDNEVVQEQQIPEEFLGDWKGKIVAYDREIEVTLNADSQDGLRISMHGQQEKKIDIAVLTNSFMLGYFSEVIPTPEGKRYPDQIRLALVRQGDRLSGTATIDQWIEDRQIRYELSSWIKLSKN